MNARADPRTRPADIRGRTAGHPAGRLDGSLPRNWGAPVHLSAAHDRLPAAPAGQIQTLFTLQAFTPGWADTGKLVAGQRLGRTVYIRGALYEHSPAALLRCRQSGCPWAAAPVAVSIDPAPPTAQIRSMGESTEAELVEIGRGAARDVAGEGPVEGVEVNDGLDSLGRPALNFHFSIDLDRVALRSGLVLARLTQQLRDALHARGHDGFPYVQIMGRADWEKRRGA